MKPSSYLVGLAAVALQAQTWTVRVEEPTGIYARDAEVVRVPFNRLAGERKGYRVLDGEGREVASQAGKDALYFPVTLIPGETPQFRVTCCAEIPTAGVVTMEEPLVRRAGTQRLLLRNSRFRLTLDLRTGAFIEAYSLTAAARRSVNLVETTPDKLDPNDIHGQGSRPPQPIGDNPGWTSLGGAGAFTTVELLETGPLAARVRLRRGDDLWELSWTATGGWLRWKASGGFRFSSVSALPYLPFDRFVDGDESRWPTGPEPSEPPNAKVGVREWTQPPGGHFAYYRRAENYGAFGVVTLDDSLNWQGAGSRRFRGITATPNTPAEIVMTFPRWAGDETVMQARQEARCLRQPLLVGVTGGEPRAMLRDEAAMRSLSPSLSLDGDWELAWGEKGQGPSSEWRRVRVPGTAHVQWLPTADLYTRKANWVSSKEWWYRTKFRVPDDYAGKRLALQFDATDYYAELWLDGALTGRHEGYIDPYEYDLTGQLKAGQEHELRVRVWTPVHYYWRHRPYTIKGSYGGVDQKPDDITALGITRSVRLVARSGDRIGPVAVDTRLLDNGDAEIQVEVEGSSPEARCSFSLTPRTFLGEGMGASGLCRRHVFRVRNPRLWWTWDHGKPDLYTVGVQRMDGSDLIELRIGIREFERIGDQFYLNRKRIFLRGTSSYYHLFLSEMNQASHARDLELMLGMNVNLVRLHCHFTNREFYELADERGVLVWQDFLEAWYPQDTRFSLRAASLYENHIRYVRNHPSVIAWAPSDEEDLENYRDLSKHLVSRLAFLDPQQRPVVRSTGRWQDSHLYNGWYGGSIWDYTRIKDNLVTELGATTLPAAASIERFLPGKWPPGRFPDDWRFHKLQIAEAMAAWGEPKGLTLAEYVPRTQAYGARLFQLAIERVRRRKDEGAGGIFHFFAIDIWPSVTMAAYDFYRVPTKVVDTVRRSFEPVLASIEYSSDSLPATKGDAQFPLWIVNDRHQEFRGVVEWMGGRQEVFVPADSSRKVGQVKWKTAGPGPAQLTLTVRDLGGSVVSENRYDFTVRR